MRRYMKIIIVNPKVSVTSYTACNTIEISTPTKNTLIYRPILPIFAGKKKDFPKEEATIIPQKICTNTEKTLLKIQVVTTSDPRPFDERMLER